ncbi:nitrate- and nitrite sensing domain-containing protein [Streptomyces sp. NPDC006367]|uniref:nitrate- and nitrite sensing domain-containing protein n=1 Tax=unclassified Streptomyces TaxID=2593676 RepID=UPI0033ABF7A8
MRFRGKSIRRKIVALLLVPLVSLTAIWAFATVLTGREASRLFDVSTLVEKVGYPVEDTVRVLQQERRQTLVHLADPRAADGLSALRRSRTATDEAVAELRRNAGNGDVRDALGPAEGERLTAVLDALAGLDSLRRGVEDGTVGRTQALGLYNRLVDPCHALLTDLHVIDDVGLDKQYRALVDVSRARELLSREDALLGSALVTGRLTRDETRTVSDLVAQRTVLYESSLPLLPAAERGRYESFWKNASSAPLRTAEEAVVSAAGGMPDGVTAKSWDTAAGKVLDELGDLDGHAADRHQDRVRPVATNVITKAVVVGALGLIAVLFSLFLSVRVGRSLVRDLRQLRLEAHEAAGVRLPGVMRRLSAGEQVDVETEVPRLEYDRNEIGEVGQALNTLQRAAVEAAVKQAELRAGVSEVFVNLARRSQVLLHKQLTLLDAMERRTEDTEELADLFRLDHLTTRMRRHAEGLVILSGAVPSRQWRKPVRLMDVVRAAVAEVEDYERIEVRRLPGIAVTGPAVADLTHLVAELLENATVFSPPHTAVQVLGERVANGFALEIHDRGLGMTADALLDANLRLAETPEFELSDTDRLGLFVVSRLARRQNVRVSLRPSPYGGITAVVLLPDALLSDEVPDTDGVGFRLDGSRRAEEHERGDGSRSALAHLPVRLPGRPAPLLDGPVELEAPVDLDALDDLPAALDDQDGEGGEGGLFRPRRSAGTRDAPADRRGERRRPASDALGRPTAGPGRLPEDGEQPEAPDRTGGQARPGGAPAPGAEDGPGAPVPLPRRRTPKLVSSHGRPVPGRGTRDRADDAPRPGTGQGALRTEPDTPPALPVRRRREDTPSDTAGRETEHAPGRPGPDTTDGGTLPRRVRQAGLAPRLRRSAGRPDEERREPAGRDAEEVRDRMASLQRGWQRGRAENAAGDDTTDDTTDDATGGTRPPAPRAPQAPRAPHRTTEGDGR